MPETETTGNNDQNLHLGHEPTYVWSPRSIPLARDLSEGARRLCVVVADPRALKMALAEIRKADRSTSLVERIARELRS